MSPEAADRQPTEHDLRWLRRALSLAYKGRYRAPPNPLVGALVVKNGELLAEGYHREVGGPHAEIDALDRVPTGLARGATVYVNLEPCAHYGRTPPCAERLIQEGVERVVCCHVDPHPEVAGGGLRLLAEAGVEVAVGGPVEDAVVLNMSFLVRQVMNRPSVTLKWAMSLDGKIATVSGESQWISSPSGRRWALDLRETHDAILVGSGTALADDPRLTRRLAKAGGPILRVVVDRRLRLRRSASMFGLPGPVLVYTENHSTKAISELQKAGAEVVVLEAASVTAVIEDLVKRGVGSVLVEGGGEMLAAFAQAELFDQVAVCCAPRLLAGHAALGPLGGDGWSALAGAPQLRRLRSKRCGDDLILTAIRDGCLRDLLQSVGA